MTYTFRNPMLIYPNKNERVEYLGIIVLPVPAHDADGVPIFVKFKIPEYFPYQEPVVTADLPAYYEMRRIAFVKELEDWKKTQRLINIARRCQETFSRELVN